MLINNKNDQDSNFNSGSCYIKTWISKLAYVGLCMDGIKYLFTGAKDIIVEE